MQHAEASRLCVERPGVGEACARVDAQLYGNGPLGCARIDDGGARRRDMTIESGRPKSGHHPLPHGLFSVKEGSTAVVEEADE